ncbi:unnamed protein product [Didymodactylos carnosus]|uniref:Uncharacterized protein n=1 Tax=Didymodactylos carnosus TaxID=1234261 RepID=A0A815H0U9_9BILA|nr:unnamed protein product [Didymodactylos carnosus]CAF4210826.1 unnamed protein product [Didymodactylos carnosus]
MSAKKKNPVTLIVHSDGAPLIRTTRVSLWPCFASIVELPPPVREYQTNIVVLALWSAKQKPNVNVFLEETMKDLKDLMRHGTSIFIGDQEYNICLSTQFFLSDLPAKALFCHTINFNGYSACTCCCTKGVWSNIYKTVLYSYAGNDYTSRTHDGYLKAAQEAL